MRIALSAILAFFCLTASAAYMSDDYVLSRVDAQSNLSHSAVLSIWQDETGLMWFGTYDGLNCYDGRKMIVFRSDYPEYSGLTNNVIMKVCQADNNSLWCSTDYSLNKFSMDTFTTEVYDFDEDVSVFSNKRGDTYLVRGDRLYYYNTHEKDFIETASGLSSGSTNIDKKLYVSPHGELWYFNEDSGKVRIWHPSSFSGDKESVKISHSLYDFHTKGIKEVFCQNETIAFVDVDQDLYIYNVVNRSKLYVRNIAQLVEQYGLIHGIVSFYEDIFIGFAVNGLVKLSSSQKYEPEEIDKNIRIYGMYKDVEQGVLWIATDGQGVVSYARQSHIATTVMTDDISPGIHRQIRSVMTDERGNLWLGTKGDGLVKISDYEGLAKDEGDSEIEIICPDERFDAEDYIRANHEFQVYSMKRSETRNGFWVGTGVTGLYWYSYDSDELVPVQKDGKPLIKEIHSIVEVGDSLLYVASAVDGLMKIKLDRNGNGTGLLKEAEWIEIADENHPIKAFFPMIHGNDSTLWLGSIADGLVRYNCKSDDYEIIRISDMHNHVSDHVLSLCLSKSGRLYVGTTSGLLSFNPDGDISEAVYVGREAGLLNDMIHGIIEDYNGIIWLSTNKGIAKYNPVSGIVHNYYYTSGVALGEFCDDAYFRSPYDGTIFFGGVNGLLWINGYDEENMQISRELLLRGLTVDRREVNISDFYKTGQSGARSLRFKGRKVSFSIIYGVPDFINANDIEFSYMLEGYDENWSVFGGTTEAMFTSVPAGNYEFMVRYKKDVFDSDYKVFTIPVQVLSPWYLSTVAKILYISFAVLLSFFIFRRLRRILVKRAYSKAPVGKMPDTGQDILDRMSLIYQCCEQLRDEGLTCQRRLHIIDTIKDSLSGILHDGGRFEDTLSLLPSAFVVSGTEKIADISNEVYNVILNEGGDLSRLEIVVSPTMTYPVYRNALRRILYYVYTWLAKAGTEGKIVFEKDERRWLRLVLKASWADVWSLYEDISASYGYVFESTGVALKHFDKGDASILQFEFNPADVIENSDSDKSHIVLLGNSSDLSWLIGDLLSPGYVVHQAQMSEDAFQLIQDCSAVLLMVDMRLYEGREEEFLRKLYQNGRALTKASFLPMFTWNTDQEVCKELILMSDAYMMLPYDVLMLCNVVHKAIHGKKSVSRLQVGDMFDPVYGDLSPDDSLFLKKVISIVDENLEREDLGTSLVADRMALSTSSFYRRFKKITGGALEVMIKNYRLEKAAVLLKDPGTTIAEVISDVGISSRSYFYKEFSKKYGMTPKEYKDRLCSH